MKRERETTEMLSRVVSFGKLPNLDEGRVSKRRRRDSEVSKSSKRGWGTKMAKLDPSAHEPLAPSFVLWPCREVRKLTEADAKP